ncbi:hypothetical protein JCM8547_003208 [Rhodosporidiobolus lusitaniae]
MAAAPLKVSTNLHGPGFEPSVSLPSPPLTPQLPSSRHGGNDEHPSRDLADSRNETVVDGMDGAHYGADGPASSAHSTANLAVYESKQAKHRRWMRELACHFSLFIAGWGDASSGPLIPYIQAHYNISYTVVSMLFVGQMAGFLVASVVTSYLNTRFGLGKTIVIGSVFQGVAYALLIAAFPFPVVPVIMALGGLGLALQDSMANCFVATLPNSEKKLGYLHGSYGLGAAVVPLAATAFASSGILFARFYSISAGIAVINTLLLLYGFKFKYRLDTPEDPDLTMDAPGIPPITVDGGRDIELVERRESTAVQSVVDKTASLSDVEGGRVEPTQLDTAFSTPAREEKKSWKEDVLVQALHKRSTIFISIFAFLYVGAEVSMGGWIVTFMQTDRNGGPDAGYVASGYWFGLMLGRILLPSLTLLMGEQNSIYVYNSTALALEFSIWYADSLVGNAVVVALIGVLMGPSYPVLVSVLSKLLPRHLHAPAISFAAAFGQVGAACFPFMTGALAGRFEPIVLQPVMIVLLFGMMVCWFFVPRIQKKSQ